MKIEYFLATKLSFKIHFPVDVKFIEIIYIVQINEFNMISQLKSPMNEERCVSNKIHVS